MTDVKAGWIYRPPEVERYTDRQLQQAHAKSMRKAAYWRSMMIPGSRLYTPRNAADGFWWGKQVLRDAREFRAEIERRKQEG